MPIVDVRDVAWAHVQAMTAPGAAGQRILLASGRPIAMKRIGAILKENVPDAAGKVPTRTIPDLVVRLIALFRPEFALEGATALRLLAVSVAFMMLFALAPTYLKFRRRHGWLFQAVGVEPVMFCSTSIPGFAAVAPCT